MSVKIMGNVWDYDIPRDEKFILLAYADHASHDGTNIYPAVSTIAKKTGYSERSVQLITRKLQKMGLLIPDGKGAKGTNKWKIPLQWGENSAPAISAGVKNEAPEGENNGKKGVKPIAPDSSLTRPEPSFKKRKESASKPDFKSLSPGDYRKIPELKLFIDATGWIPGSFVLETVYDFVHAGLTGVQIATAFKAWMARGYKAGNVEGYLTWARDGIPPARAFTKQSQSNQPLQPAARHI